MKRERDYIWQIERDSSHRINEINGSIQLLLLSHRSQQVAPSSQLMRVTYELVPARLPILRRTR